jgi:rod shape-determining protein MreC
MGRDTRRTRLLLASLLVIALVLITIDVGASKHSDGIRRVADSVVGPVERGAAAVVRPIRNAFGSIGDQDKERRRADALASENAALKRELAADQEATRQAVDLSKLGLLTRDAAVRTVNTRVVAVGDTTGTERTVDIGAGSDSGLAVGQLVINSDGLVGVLVRVGSTVSTVRLADDPRTVIGARLVTSRALGTVTGASSTSHLDFTLYDPSLPVKPGERVVTYGSADYAGGIPIGVTVDSGAIGTAANAGSLTQAITVRPYVHFGSLDLVGVIIGSRAAGTK